MDNEQSNYLRPATPEKRKLRLAKDFFVNFLKLLSFRGIILSVTLTAAIWSTWIGTLLAFEKIPTFHLARSNPATFGLTICFLYICAIAFVTASSAREIAIHHRQKGFKSWLSLGPNPLQTLKTILVATAVGVVVPILFLFADGIWGLPRRFSGPLPQYLLLITFYGPLLMAYSSIGIAPLISADQGLTPANAIKTAIALGKENRLKIFAFVACTSFLWFFGHYLYLVPGILLFEWQRQNMVSLYRRLIEVKTVIEPIPQPVFSTAATVPEVKQEEQLLNV